MSTSPRRSQRGSGSLNDNSSVYHGLRNQGSTCYLNSVLQVLFMTTEFRQAVKRYASEHEDTPHIDKQLSALFDRLRRSTGTTVDITNKLGIRSVHKQSDAAEHLEKILTLSSSEASQTFRGALVQKTTCLGCRTETNAEEPFWFLPLTLDNSGSESYSVWEGIAEFFKYSDLKGEDQLYCDDCEDKRDATMGFEVKHHPEVLILLLKRFEFDYGCMSYVKNSCPVDVPCTLHMPKGQDQVYELYGFVEHFGSLKGGHYTATIKSHGDRDAAWYNFNDSSVVQLNRNRVPMDNQIHFPTESQSAYVLFYKRKKHSTTNNNRKPSTNGSPHASIEQGWDVAKRDGGDEAPELDRVKAGVTGPSPDPGRAGTLDNRASGKRSSPSDRRPHGDGSVPADPRGDVLTGREKNEGRKKARDGEEVADDQARKRSSVGQVPESRADQSEEVREALKRSNNRGSKYDGQEGEEMQEKRKEKEKDGAGKVVSRSEEHSGGHGKMSHDAITRDPEHEPLAGREGSVEAAAPDAKSRKKKGFFRNPFKNRSTKTDKKKKEKDEAKKQKKEMQKHSRTGCSWPCLKSKRND